MKEYLIGQYEKSMPNEWTIEEKLSASKECGFDYVEISIDETSEKLSRIYDECFLSEAKSAVEKTRQPIISMCFSAQRKYPLGSENKETEEKALEISYKAIDFARKLGIRIIQLAGYDVYYEKSTEKTKERFLKNLGKVVKYAAASGVMLGFETMETDFMNTCEKAMKYVNAINSPYLNVYPDIGNIINATKAPAKDLDAANGHIVAVHLKETVDGVFREVPFGTGHTNYVEAINKARSFGVGLFVLEFWYDKTKEPKAYIKDGYDFITGKFRLSTFTGE